MTHNNGHHDEAPEPATPFDEATDLIDDGDEMIELGQVRMPPVRALVILGGVLVAPLFALVFGLDVALGVLVAAMGVTTWMAWEGARHLVPVQADRLRKAALLNAAVAVIVLLLLVIRLIV